MTQTTDLTTSFSLLEIRQPRPSRHANLAPATPMPIIPAPGPPLTYTLLTPSYPSYPSTPAYAPESSIQLCHNAQLRAPIEKNPFPEDYSLRVPPRRFDYPYPWVLEPRNNHGPAIRPRTAPYKLPKHREANGWRPPSPSPEYRAFLDECNRMPEVQAGMWTEGQKEQETKEAVGKGAVGKMAEAA